MCTARQGGREEARTDRKNFMFKCSHPALKYTFYFIVSHLLQETFLVNIIQESVTCLSYCLQKQLGIELYSVWKTVYITVYLFIFFTFLKIEVQLIYNVVLISAVHLEGWDREGGREVQEGGDMGIYVYIQLIHFIIQQKLTHHCKAIILQ